MGKPSAKSSSFLSGQPAVLEEPHLPAPSQPDTGADLQPGPAPAHAHDALSIDGPRTGPSPRPSALRGHGRPARLPEHQHRGDDKSAAGAVTAAFATPATSPANTQSEGEKPASVTFEQKPGWPARAKAGSKRFLQHTKDAILHSWINVLLVFVPVGIAVNYAPGDFGGNKASIVFALNAVSIVPLAGLLAHATEAVASAMGDTWASLLNVTFGNAVELIIFVIALAKDEIRIVQAAILGSILANLLLILGMAFLFGGLRYREQIYNSTVTQMSACLLSLSVMSLLLPTAFHASFSGEALADKNTLKISRGTSVVLLCVYVLYLLFQLKSHAYMYESTPQQIIDEESHPGVLADMMNSSSSDDSSSSSSSESDDSSAGSHTTTRKRIKRAFRSRRLRRKSNASSAQSTTNTSGLNSPTREKPGPSEESQEYFDQASKKRSPRNTVGPSNGDEADTDGELDDGTPRVRDFEAERTENSKSPERVRWKRSSKKHAKKSRKASQDEKAETAVPSGAPPLETEVTDEANLQTTSNQTRRPFVLGRTISRPNFRPPLPSLLTNTVFSSQYPPTGTAQAPALAVARAAKTELRRTNSLPDRLNRSDQGGAAQNVNQPYADFDRRPGVLAINQADVIRKDVKDDGKPALSRTAAVVLLLCTTALVAFCAELLVDAIPDMLSDSTVSQTFIGLIILPIVGNAAEHVTAVTVATKNKMDLAIGVAVGSSIQIALLVTPFVVLLGWILDKNMSLYFSIFETVSLFVTAFVVNFLVLDGRSNYLEGSLLIAAYVIIGVAAFFYPSEAQQSEVGGGVGPAGRMLMMMM